jgi:hypothetical protein
MVAVPRTAASQATTAGLDDSAVAFTNVTVIDGSDSLPRRDQTVVVRGNRIVAVGPSRETSPPPRSRVVDGRGKFLVPGFWDMHVHTDVPDGRDVLALYVVNGVTGVRDMAGRWEVLASWKHEISEGRLLGPRIVASGPYLEGGDIPIPHVLVRAPNDAATAVDSLIRLGVDFVKIHGQLTPESYFAAARAARRRGIPFAGHVPGRVTAEEASDSGQQSLEHMLAIRTPCTSAESTALAPRYRVQSVLGRCTGESLAPLMARFVRNGTWIVPTMVAQYEIAQWPRRELPGDAFGKYLPDTLRRYVASIFPVPSDVPRGADVVGRRLLEKRLALVGEMHQVLLEADPLQDIRNTRRVAAVVLDGRFFGPQARDSILRRRGAPPAAGRPRGPA